MSDQLDHPKISKNVGQLEGEHQEDDDVREDGMEPISPTEELWHSTWDVELWGDTVAPLLPHELSVAPTNEPGHSAWDVKLLSDSTNSALKLVHKLTQEGGTYVSFSTDGKYLATASSLGIVTIFASKTGKRIR